MGLSGKYRLGRDKWDTAAMLENIGYFEAHLLMVGQLFNKGIYTRSYIHSPRQSDSQTVRQIDNQTIRHSQTDGREGRSVFTMCIVYIVQRDT